MRILLTITMLIFGLFSTQSFAENTWQKPALSNCNSGDTQCKHGNFCVNSASDACLAHVGKTTEGQGRSPLLAGCFQRKMVQCFKAITKSDTVSTNVTKSPDAWNCVYNTGKKADPTHCRRTNFCLDTAGTTCSEKVGAAKYTSKGQMEMVTCIKETEISCMRELN